MYWFYPKRMMSRLCIEALRAGIEVDYVRDLIRKRTLLPEDDAPENWPWPVRIYALGLFRVELDGHDFEKAKGQNKPLELLQVLIALGRTDVKTDRIAEILWSDADGDAAVSAFTTTLSRLRKLIGEEMIIVRGGRVSLDERRCWLDVRALERPFDESKLTEADQEEIQDRLEKLLALYQGPFLGDEGGGWVRRQRDRSRDAFVRHLSRLFASLRTAEAPDSITYALEKVENIDPLAAQRCRALAKA